MTKSLPRAASTASGDRIELMSTFVRIVEAGSISAAAASMGTTQPTVSRRLQLLEKQLGLRLLKRSTHAMALTEDGQRCFDGARELLADWHAFEADLRGAGDEPEGVLRVVAPHAFGQAQLVGPVADYLARYPRVSIEWLLHDRAPDFVAHNVDCAIQVGEVSDPNVVAIALADVPRIVVAAPALLRDRPVVDHPAQLAELPWLSLRAFYRTEMALSNAASGERHRVHFQPRLATDSLYALRSAALLGVGVAVGSAWVLNEDIAAGRLQHLLPDWQAAPLPMYLVYPHARYYPARLRRFLETIREAAPAAVRGALWSS
ncbi:LysR family transcriptional regulator [Xylophilus sp. GOD-11R]|uniref:LysR family transcriptional regulator n=1 Tax=Xylophilus sp. GOD-11R TaxID=3089814 RepID=UPI00298D0AF3|nr:LysR family transcriptional regulator [Xylophilus sp. GOD-11R]WPB57702.1 LysR family transcriptional regulator [Xylophilus sp. GOD-11R]